MSCVFVFPKYFLCGSYLEIVSLSIPPADPPLFLFYYLRGSAQSSKGCVLEQELKLSFSGDVTDVTNGELLTQLSLINTTVSYKHNCLFGAISQ